MKLKENIPKDFNGYRAQIDRDGWFLKGQLIIIAILFLGIMGYFLGVV